MSTFRSCICSSRSLTCAIVITLVMSGLILPAHAADEETLVIGAILPLTGTSATFGDRVQKAMELAQSELPDPLRAKVRIVALDDAWSAKGSVTAFQHGVNVEKVNAVTVLGSASGLAVAPLAEAKKIPLIAIGASNINVVRGRKYCFLNWVTPEAEAQLLVKELKRRNYRRLGVVGAEQEGMKAIYAAVAAELRQQALLERVAADEWFAANETDYRTFIARSKAKKLEAMLLFLLPGSISSFAKQARQAGFSGDLIGVELFEDENEVRASDGALLNQWYVTAASTPEFEAKFQNRFKEKSAFGTANGYDAVKMLAAAFEKHASSDGTKLAEFLSTVRDFRGAAGTYSATGDNRFTLPAGLRKVTSAGFVDLK